MKIIYLWFSLVLDISSIDMTTLNVCVDIGNTKIKSGIFIKNKLVELISGLDSLNVFLNKEFKKRKEIKVNCIISTVRKKIPKELLKNKKKFINFVILSDKSKLPITIDYKTPKTLGRDRIAAAVGAKKLFPTDNCIVIDAGTCITYDFVDKNSVFKGGNISPGIHMRIEAMHKFTHNLPLVDLKVNKDPLGKSTDEALQNGAVRGTFLEIYSFIQLILDKYGNSKVVFTGGDAKYFVNYFKTTIFANQNLVFIGLNEILKEYE